MTVSRLSGLAPGPRARQVLAGLALAALALVMARDIRRWGGDGGAPGRPAVRAGDLPFRLVDVSSRTGVVNLHQKEAVHPSLANVAPWLVSVSASVAVADVDGDGRPDVFLTNAAKGSRNRLYRNNGDGTFTDITVRAGLADANREAGAIRGFFFDYDNDGRKDLLLTTTWRAKLFHNEGGGRFRDATRRSGLRHVGPSPSVNAFDYDGDGFLDLVIGLYWEAVRFDAPSRYDFMQTAEEYSAHGGTARIYHNNGDGTFSPAPRNLGVRNPRWTQAVGVYDLRGTGRQDLHIAPDYGQEALYLNPGCRPGAECRLVDASAELQDNQEMNNMSSEMGEPFSDGVVHLFVSNAYVPPREVKGNVLWRVGKDGRFRDAARELGVDRCGWAWGAKFLDLDNDPFLDLVVVNGYISADPRREYAVSMEDFTGMPGGMGDARNWPAMGDASMDGYQQSCVYYNRGDRFENVVDATVLKDDLYDGRGLAVIDYLNDGSLGFVVANQGQPARFFHSEQRNSNHWVGFSLEGTRSNRDAFGAKVSVRLRGGRTLTRELEPGNGFMAESDPRLHFGLGPDPVIEEVVVRWPAGGVQRLPAPALDRYHALKEPG